MVREDKSLRPIETKQGNPIGEKKKKVFRAGKAVKEPLAHC
jgi:nucleoid DNA-binding protein